MPYKNPEDRRRADRERRRRQRAGAIEHPRTTMAAGTQKKLSAPLGDRPTVADLATVVAVEINRVREARVETLARARCLGYLAGCLLRTLEVGELEERLKSLEAALLNQNGAPK